MEVYVADDRGRMHVLSKQNVKYLKRNMLLSSLAHQSVGWVGGWVGGGGKGK